MSNIKKSILILAVIFICITKIYSQNYNINKYSKISSTSGMFSGMSSNLQRLGTCIINIGDIDKDGIADLAVSAYDIANQTGNIFILFINKNQTVKSFTRIGPNIGGLNGTFNNSMQSFGQSISTLGDLNDDGINDIIVGNSSGGGNSKGEIYILMLTEQGMVKSYKILGSNDFVLNNDEYFGSSVASLKDIDGDNLNEIVVGSTGNNDGGGYYGIVYIIFLDKQLVIKKTQKISSTNGNFKGVLSGGALFGKTLVNAGDINKDKIEDLIVGSFEPLWVLMLDSSAKVKAFQKIDSDSGNYTDTIKSGELFGSNITNLGDLDNDSIPDLAVSSVTDNVNSINTGRVRILFLNSNGTVKSIKRIDNNSLNFSGVLKDGDYFGSGLSGGFDLDGDFKNDLIVGAFGTDDGGTDKGAIYLLSLDGAVHPTPPKALWRVNTTSGNQNTVFNFTQYSTGFSSTYKWSITPNTFTYQNGTSDTSANPIVKFNQTANYSVQLKVTNPFNSDSLLRSSYINIQTVGINNLTKNSAAISIFPNPTSGLVQIQSPVSMQSILVFDITGKQLLQQEPNSRTDEINISHLPQGLYQIHVQTEMGVLVKKLVKE